MYSGMLANVAEGSYEIFETVGEGMTCRDYDLSYDQATSPDLIKGLFADKLTLAVQMKQAGWKEQDIENYVNSRKPMAKDVVTLRKSQFTKDPMLSEVIQTLWKNGWEYTEIHCAHCRYGSNMKENDRNLISYRPNQVKGK
jgi:hypothetical protein